MMNVRPRLMPTDHQTALQDHQPGSIAIEAIDHLLGEVEHHLLMWIHTLLNLGVLDREAAPQGVGRGAQYTEVDTTRVGIGPEQDLLRQEHTLLDEIPMPDHLPELAVIPDLHLLELDPLRHNVNATNDELTLRQLARLPPDTLRKTIATVQLLENAPALHCDTQETSHGPDHQCHLMVPHVKFIQTGCQGYLELALLPTQIPVNRHIQLAPPIEIDHHPAVPALHPKQDLLRVSTVNARLHFLLGENRHLIRETNIAMAQPQRLIQTLSEMSPQDQATATVTGALHQVLLRIKIALPHPRDGPYSAPRGRGGGFHSGPPPSRPSYDSRSPTDGPPAAPRGGLPHSSSHGPPPSSYYSDHRDTGPPPHRPPFRTNNSSSTTYPRTQRFNTHLGDLPRPTPGGKINDAGIDPAAAKRLQELEEQKRKLQEQIDEKQASKRKAVREWERGEQEVRRDGLRSELAERSLEGLTGEGAGVGSAF
ncbi:MAG: hypothetical protein Q9201_002779 [Fulgogasparrea decipioides]